MKSNLYVQYNGQEFANKTLEKKFKELWKNNERKIKEIKDLELYLNVHEGKCYYVVNGQEKGDFEIKQNEVAG